MDKKSYDFSGWATKINIKCSDGATILSNAFVDNDKKTVPLVWSHDHKDASNVLGHAYLENRPGEGVYCYCKFNNNEKAKAAKELVRNGDISSLSIFANQLTRQGSSVSHGTIREVSLVLAGANPGAVIDNVLVHSADGEAIVDETQAKIFHLDDEITFIEHKCEPEDDKIENEKNKKSTKEDTKVEDPKEKVTEEGGAGETVKDVFNTLSEKQKQSVYAIIGFLLKDKEGDEEDTEMKHNLFENEDDIYGDDVITHDDELAVFAEAKKCGSLKDAAASILKHGITDIGNLMPEYQNVNKVPVTINNNDGWVKKIMNAVHHTPFSKIKSTAVNITADEARAKGYVKGTQKVSEVVVALKRTTEPQTVYKLQKLDRDDIVDITDFDVVAFIKDEMRVKLDEELARAFLIGDGRTADDNYKINETKIRPIYGDNSVYTINRVLTEDATTGLTEDQANAAFAKKFIRDVIKSRKQWKGTGRPTLYTTEDMLTNMLLIEDTNGRVIYETVEKLATTLRVAEIVTVTPMEGCTRTNDDSTFDFDCIGILANLNDYNVGADKGGNINLFDDFDIDYNKYTYLIETRCSGALVVPYAAISFEKKYAHVAG